MGNFMQDGVMDFCGAVSADEMPGERDPFAAVLAAALSPDGTIPRESPVGEAVVGEEIEGVAFYGDWIVAGQQSVRNPNVGWVDHFLSLIHSSSQVTMAATRLLCSLICRIISSAVGIGDDSQACHT